jgi:hypothetical protein
MTNGSPVTGAHPVHKSLFLDGTKWELKRTKKGRKAEQRCHVAFCRNLGRAEYRTYPDGRRRMVYHTICEKCESRRWRANNPATAAFKDLRHNARNRGIKFSLSLDFFMYLWNQGYGQHRGHKSFQLHLDRIDPDQGYIDSNVRVITVAENVAKGNVERHRHDHAGQPVAHAWVDEDLCPF